MMRHGYFVPKRGLFGDEAFAAEARALWGSSIAGGFTDYGRYDGASVFQRADGSVVRRLVVQDYFSEDLRVRAVDL
jgi:hypothetical protein